MAQLVEQRIRNAQAVGSSPTTSSSRRKRRIAYGDGLFHFITKLSCAHSAAPRFQNRNRFASLQMWRAPAGAGGGLRVWFWARTLKEDRF